MRSFLKKLYHRLPGVHAKPSPRKLLADIDARLRKVQQSLQGLTHLSVMQTRQAILVLPKYADPKHLARFESSTFSQNGEDGILAEIFRRIGAASKTFVEVGCGDGLQNNTALLLATGWRGVWVEGDPKFCEAIRHGLAHPLSNGSLKLQEGLIVQENADRLLPKSIAADDLDLLSLDIDQHTYWLWRWLRRFRPRVAVVEYNAAWPPTVDWVAQYLPDRVWDGTASYGASLAALVRLGREFGYALVGCDLSGVNAFFVRQDLVGDHFYLPGDVGAHYEPVRHILGRISGFTRSYRMFDDAVQEHPAR
jgi:hypothetical protein